MTLVWLGWTIVYAVVIWGVDTAYALLERWLRDADRRAQEVAARLRFVIPLGLAFLIGLQLRAWGWVLSPFLVIVVTMLAFSIVDYLRRPASERQQAGRGAHLGDRRNGHRCRGGHPRRHSRGHDRSLVAWRLSGPPCPLLQMRLGGRVMTDPSQGRPPASSTPR